MRRGLVRWRLVRRGLVRRGLMRGGLVWWRLVRRGLERPRLERLCLGEWRHRKERLGGACFKGKWRRASCLPGVGRQHRSNRRAIHAPGAIVSDVGVEHVRGAVDPNVRVEHVRGAIVAEARVRRRVGVGRAHGKIPRSVGCQRHQAVERTEHLRALAAAHLSMARNQLVGTDTKRGAAGRAAGEHQHERLFPNRSTTRHGTRRVMGAAASA